MKSMYLCGMLFLASISVCAQEKIIDTLKSDYYKRKIEISNSKYLVTIGLSLIKNGGNLILPKENLYFKTPLFIEAERRFNSKLSLSISASTNELMIQSETKLFVSIDAIGQYYFDDYLFSNKNIETYSGLGIGHYFYDDKGKITLDLTGGSRYWFSNQFGASLQGLAKFGLQTKDDLIKNYYQLFFGVVWRNCSLKK